MTEINTKLHSRAGRLAMTGLAGGILASLAMNLQAINLGQASPGIGAYVSAVIWPCALFTAIEIMLHTPWASSARDGLTKWAGLMSVAGMSAWISYWHGVHVLTAFHYDVASAHFGPVAVDTMMAMSALALNRVGQARRRTVSDMAGQDRTPPVAAEQDVAASEAAFRGQLDTGHADSVADEASNYLERMAMAVSGPSVLPVPVSPAPTARASRGPRTSLDLAELARVLDGLAPHVASNKEADELAAGHYGVSGRTVRRARASIEAGWVDLRASIEGRPVSGVPVN